MKRTYPAVTLLLALVSLLPASGRAQEIVFPGPTLVTGSGPVSVATGDFNGDGKPDFVTANSASNTISVLMGKGGATFSPKVDYATGAYPLSVATGDFNGDGKLDIVVVNRGVYNSATKKYIGSMVSVFLGKGDGTFSPKTDYVAGNGPVSVAAGDFDGDGKLDLAVVNFLDNTVSVLRGNGDGTFAAKADYATGSTPNSIAVGDFNGDGKLDIVTTAANNNNYNSNIIVFLNKGNGTFAAPVSYATTSSTASIAVGDFDGDGKLDLAVATNYSYGSVTIHLGNGDGTFTYKANYVTGGGAYAVITGDFNGDGKLDIATANGSVNVFMGNGDGTFAPNVNYRTGYLPVSIAIADFDGDGKPDIVTANRGDFVYDPSIYTGASASVLLNNGNGTFAAKAEYTTDSFPHAVAVGDFNGDGKPDLVALNSNSQAVSLFRGQGDGTFAAKLDTPSGQFTSLAVADFDGDGKLDIVAVDFNFNTMSVLFGKGNGTFAAQVDYSPGLYPEAVIAGDFNGDGKPDIVTANLGQFNQTIQNYDQSYISARLNSGDGTFGTYASQIHSPTGSAPVALASGDFNGDGKLDIVTANANANTVSILLGNGDGTFHAKVDYAVGSAPDAVAVGDFNGDGKLDIVVGNAYDNTVSVLLGKGDGTFGAKGSYPTGAEPYSVTLGDFNGDGILDIATANVAANTVSVLLGKGDGTFGAKVDYVTNLSPYWVVAGDFNGDGKTDLAVANKDSDSVSVLLNAARRSRVSGTLALEGIAPSAAAQPVTFTFRSPGFPDFAPMLTVAPSGNFVANLPKRGGTLHIKGQNYLAANVSVDATNGNVSGVTAFLPAGDSNNDNSVDSSDFGILIGAFNSEADIPDSGYDSRADFNNDGFVDSTDFGLLIGEFNNTGAP